MNRLYGLHGVYMGRLGLEAISLSKGISSLLVDLHGEIAGLYGVHIERLGLKQ